MVNLEENEETLNIEATDDASVCRNVISTENLNVDVIDDADKELIKVCKLSRKRRQEVIPTERVTT